MTAMKCANDHCDQAAVVAAHGRDGHTLLFRTDHLTKPFGKDARCADCAVHELLSMLVSARR